MPRKIADEEYKEGDLVDAPKRKPSRSIKAQRNRLLKAKATTPITPTATAA
jgi:hypothetical protein